MDSDYDQAWEDPSAKRWVKNVLDDMAPKMSSAALVAQIVPDTEKHGPGDVKWWVELGASIMMDKPIVAIIMPGQKVPAKLRAVADEIVVLEDGVSPEGAAEVQAAFERVMGRG